MADQATDRQVTVEQLMAAIERLEQIRDHEPRFLVGHRVLCPAEHAPVKPDPVFGWLVVE